jgi:hypothetical protein
MRKCDAWLERLGVATEALDRPLPALRHKLDGRKADHHGQRRENAEHDIHGASLTLPQLFEPEEEKKR